MELGQTDDFVECSRCGSNTLYHRGTVNRRWVLCKGCGDLADADGVPWEYRGAWAADERRRLETETETEIETETDAGAG